MMENYSYSSYNSGDSSSPRSRDIDCSWDDQPPPNYKVKFMVSYNGKIHPRPHDNTLSYMGGDTKILAVDRHVKFQTLLGKLSALVGNSGGDVCFKYQLPGEDLDALITVTNDEDLEHMMLEYDRMYRGVGGSCRPTRLRLFLFQLGGSGSGSGGGGDTVSFVEEGLNSGIQQQQQGNPDYLFGLDKVKDGVVGLKEGVATGSDCGSDAVASPTEIQRQINELQRLQISGQLVRKVVGEGNVNSRVGFGGDEFLPEKVVTPPAPVPVAMHPGYVQERHGNFQVAAGVGPVGGGDQPVYLIPAGAAHGVYQAAPPPGMRPVAGHPGQGYYGVQRVVQEVYSEQQPMYGQVASMQHQQQQGQGQKMATGYGEGMGMMHQKIEHGYVQVGYDAAGRQVYYTVPGGMPPPVYQTTGAPMAAVEGKAVGSGGAVNQDGKV